MENLPKTAPTGRKRRSRKTFPFARAATLMALLLGVTALPGLSAAPQLDPLARPRLVVMISIDQFRADYLTRFTDLFLPAQRGGTVGGFRYLMERGAQFPNAHHDHTPTATGPGHSIFLTGAPPYKSGIVGNDWYDRVQRHDVYCVQDDASPVVGTDAKLKGISPEHLKVTTLGDELKMATGGQSRVFGIAFKDRASVLMAGHLADSVYWFDDSTGRWISSRYYRKDGTLPAWVTALNAEKRPQSYFGKQWTLSVSNAALARLWTPTGKYGTNPSGLGNEFPHRINGDPNAPNQAAFRAFTTTPFGNDYVFQSAERLVSEERLGWDETTDVLAINLSSNDYIGHAYGPDSAEVLDATVRTDRALSGFFNFLARTVPGGLENVDVVLSADHGVAPVGQAVIDAGVPGGRWNAQAAAKKVDDALTARFGEGKWVVSYNEPYLWLNQELIRQHGIRRTDAEDAAAAALEEIPGIYAAYPRHRVLENSLPQTDITRRVMRSFHPRLSGDVVIVSEPFWIAGGLTGSTHGEPYTYDTHVPLLIAGWGVRPGTYTERVSTLDVAPTLAFLTHVQQPSGSEGQVLSRALLQDGAYR